MVVINLIITFISKFFTLLAFLIFSPIYIDILGIDSFSIISAVLILNGILGLVDAGISPIITRDVAQNINDPSEEKKSIGSFELIYIFIFFVAFILYFLVINFVDESVFSSKLLLIIIYAKYFLFFFFFQILCRFYLSILQGRENHISGNLIFISMGIIRSGLVIFIINTFNSLESFFIWQLCISFIFVLIFRISVFYKFNFNFHSPFRYIKNVYVKVLSIKGLAAIAILSTFYGQIDRGVFLYFYDLNLLPSYTVSATFGSLISSLALIILPIILPKFSICIDSNQRNILSRISHSICWNMAAIGAVHLVLLRDGLLKEFFQDQLLLEKASTYFVFLVIAGFLSSLTLVAYAQNISLSKFRMHTNLILITVLMAIPIYWISTSLLQDIGIPIGFLVLQTMLTFFYIIFSYRNIHKIVKVFYSYILIPIIFCSFYYLIDKLILSQLAYLQDIFDIHSYLWFIISIIPLFIFVVTFFQFFYYAWWQKSLRNDITFLHKAKLI